MIKKHTHIENAVAESAVLLANNVYKHFQEGVLDVPVLQGVSLAVAPGQSLAIMGSSGSGKSTLLHILGGLDKPNHGSVVLRGRDLAQMGQAALGAWRNQHLGFVYQFHHLLPELNALDNVAMPLWIRRTSKITAAKAAHTILEKVGLSARWRHKPAELSGGERQRVAIARALVTQPACVLADEPTGNLDSNSAKTIFALMLELMQTHQTALVLVTHDHNLAASCQQCLYLHQGVLLTQQLYSSVITRE